MNTTANRAAVAKLIEPLLEQLGYSNEDDVDEVTIDRDQITVSVYLGAHRGHRIDVVRIVGAR